jgi:hypothetical protein
MVIFEERREVLEREFANLTEIARTKSKSDALLTNPDGNVKAA